MKNKKHKEDWFLGISGIIVSIGFIIFIIYYLKNVSIGEWIARENYMNNGEWLKQVGLFVATFVGFSVIINYFADLLDYLPERKKKIKSEVKD